MRDLIFLKVYKSDMRKPSELTICDNLDYLSEELRFFNWEEYPFPHVPLHFCSKNLITLEMPNSNIRQLWNEKLEFPNLTTINLSHSKHLTTLPDLSHAPNIQYVDVYGCVNLDQIHSSTVLANLVKLHAGYGGAKRINIGGSMKGTRLGLVMVFNYFDLCNSSWREWSMNKVILKIMVCGDIICDVGFEFVQMPLAEKETAELRYLLPFVRGVALLEGPIEFGYEFRQHYDYDYDSIYDLTYGFPADVVVGMKVRRRADRGGERHVVGPLTRDNMINDHHQTSTKARGGGREELMREYYCGDSNNSNATIFTRVPTSITRWSLLTELRLRKSDMVEDSLILNSLSSLFNVGSCKPLYHQTISLHIPLSAFTGTNDYHFNVERHAGWFRCHVPSYMSSHPDYDFRIEFVHW